HGCNDANHDPVAGAGSAARRASTAVLRQEECEGREHERATSFDSKGFPPFGARTPHRGCLERITRGGAPGFDRLQDSWRTNGPRSLANAPEPYHRSRCTTSSNERRFGCLIGTSGRCAG